MRRRDFIAGSAMAAGGLAFPVVSSARDKKPSKQFIELRIYHFASLEKEQAFADFLQNAAAPAFNRAGARPVGVIQAANVR